MFNRVFTFRISLVKTAASKQAVRELERRLLRR